MKLFITTSLLLFSCAFTYAQCIKTNCPAVNRLYCQADSLEKGLVSKKGGLEPEYIKALNKLYSARVAARDCEGGKWVQQIDDRIFAISTKVDSLRKAAVQANNDLKKATDKAQQAAGQAIREKKKADNAARQAEQSAQIAKISAQIADSSARITEASRLVTLASQLKQNDPTLALQLIKKACDTSHFNSDIAVQELQTLLSKTHPASYYKKKIEDTTAISSIAVSGNGQQLMVGHNDGTLSIWDDFSQPNGSPTRHILLPAAHQGTILGLAASHDGKLIISAGIDGTILVWNNRNVQRRLRQNMDPVLSVALSPDKRYVISSHENRSVNIWDLQAGGKIVQTLAITSGNALQVCFAPNGRYVALANNDEIVRVWDWQQNKVVATLEEHRGAVRSVAFSPDGQYIVSGGDDKVVRVWQWQHRLASSVVRATDSHQQPILAVAFSPTANFLVSAGQDSEIKIWKMAGNALTLHRILRGHAKAVFATGFSAFNAYVYSGSYDRSIKLWQWRQDFTVADSLLSKTSFSRATTANVTDSRIANQLIIQGERPYPIVLPAGFQRKDSSFYYSPDYRYVLASDQKLFTWLWDYTHTSRPIFTIPTAKGKSFSLSSDNSLIKSGEHLFRNLYSELMNGLLIPAMTDEDQAKYLLQTETR